MLFFPFHSMPPESGDLALFQRIYGPHTKGWIRSVQLHPPKWPSNTAEIFDQLEEADVVVMGSGFPQPFIQLMRRMGLPPRLRSLHRRGTHFLGYSAGSLALGEGYYLPFVGEDLLTQLSLLDHISMPEAKRRAAEEDLRRCVPRDDAEEFIDGLRARLEGEQELDDDQKSFLETPLWMERADGFGLTPGLTACPHYGEQFQYRKVHLEHLGRMFPGLLHVGIPNACALVTRFTEDGVASLTFRGKNHRRTPHWVRGDGDPTVMEDGVEIPLEHLGQPGDRRSGVALPVV